MKRKAFRLFFLILTLLPVVFSPGLKAQKTTGKSPFQLQFNRTGISSLKRLNDAYDTDYIAKGRALGGIAVKYRMEKGSWQSSASSGMADRRDVETYQEGGNPQHLVKYFDKYYLYHGDFNDHYSDLGLDVRFRTEGDALYWTLHFQNLADQPLIIGDINLPLPFNTSPRWNKTEMYTERLIPHSFISGHSSFIFWMRPNGVGPYLVMTPLRECPPFESGRAFKPTSLEYSDGENVFIHASASGAEALEQGGNWRFPLTSLTLAPKATSGSEATYGFKFRWAQSYQQVRDILYEEGLIDVQVVPGMTVPTDLEARFALRTRNGVDAIVPEYPGETRLEYLGEKTKDTHIYAVRFSRLGENMLTVGYGGGQKMTLEFFVTEPLETLIKKRSAHLAGFQQHRDPGKWYNGLISDWDMRNKILRGPDDTDGLKDFWVASDDPGNCKAPYIAEKNVHFPSAGEIEAVEYYIRNYLWGKLQNTDKEKYPYGIYGIPNWKEHRESRPADRDSWTGHLWRLADYPHIIMLYLNMYRIASYYPGLAHELTPEGYLERAFGTAKAYFTVPLETGRWSAIELCRMNELVIVPLIDELLANGKTEQGNWLKKQWEKKVEHYVNDAPNLLHAEYPGNPCSFESSQALARYAMEHAAKPGSGLKVGIPNARKFMDEQMTINIALRGWLEPAYYLLGISKPGSGFYMSQMAGWSVADYALYYSREPAQDLRLAYASYLGNRALMNTGTPDSGYGYWYKGIENDGGAGGAFVRDAFGEVQGKALGRGSWFYGGEADMGFGAALRTAATIVAEDPLFGLIAYGGQLAQSGKLIDIIPKDGLRQRFHVIRERTRFHLILDRDGFAPNKPITVNETLDEIRFVLESRFSAPHQTELRISGLPAGAYRVFQEDRPVSTLAVADGREFLIRLSMDDQGEKTVSIRKVH